MKWNRNTVLKAAEKYVRKKCAPLYLCKNKYGFRKEQEILRRWREIEARELRRSRKVPYLRSAWWTLAALGFSSHLQPRDHQPPHRRT